MDYVFCIFNKPTVLMHQPGFVRAMRIKKIFPKKSARKNSPMVEKKDNWK